jgi:Mg2+ and Co2+ transporter CorA
MDARKKSQMLEELEIKLVYLETKYDELDEQKNKLSKELTDDMVDQYFTILDWISNEIDDIINKMDDLKNK